MTELTEDQPTIAQVRTNRAAWAQALRSGEYEQGQGVLRRAAGDRVLPSSVEQPTKDAYCCLGVGHNIVSGTWEKGGMLSSDRENQTPIISVSGNLPLWSQEHLGLSPRDHTALVEMNDDFGFTFDQIAEVIETSDDTPGSISRVAEYLNALYRKQSQPWD